MVTAIDDENASLFVAGILDPDYLTADDHDKPADAEQMMVRLIVTEPGDVVLAICCVSWRAVLSLLVRRAGCHIFFLLMPRPAQLPRYGWCYSRWCWFSSSAA